MNLSKSLEFFKPTAVKDPIHIIGVGSIGSNVVEQLVRLGCTNIHLWDFDTVSEHNLANQNFVYADIKKPKVECVTNMALAINPHCKITLHPEGITPPYVLKGYVFLCVDSIKLRQAIVKANQYNPRVHAIFDFRTRLTDAQHYAVDMRDTEMVKAFLSTMDFTDEEATEATPTSACGVSLSVNYVVKNIVTYGIANFVNFINTKKLKTVIVSDLNTMFVMAFPEED